MSLVSLLLAPAVAGLLLLLIPARLRFVHRCVPMIVSLGILWKVLCLFPAQAQYPLSRVIVPFYGIELNIGWDGFSYFLVLLTALLVPLVFLVSSSVEKIKSYSILFLFLEFGMLGTFLAQDMVLFYICFESVLAPMSLLIAVFGGENKRYASIKLFLYTMAGSLPMLGAILYLCSHAVPGQWVFDFETLFAAPLMSSHIQWWLFVALGIGFAIKAPLFPFHTWLPDAHVQAPTGGSVILAGVMLKMGTYGFMRFCVPLFPDAIAALQPCLIAISVIGIVHGSLMCMAQKDMKRLIAYSSVAHLGTVMLGVFSMNLIGMQGGALQALNHGLSTSALFFLVGFLYERGHTKEIAAYSGLASSMPRFSLLLVLTTLASVGMPGTNGFVGEFLILLGAFQVHWAVALIAGSGVILGAVYMLTLLLQILFGEEKFPEGHQPKDLGFRETFVLAVLIGLCFYLGFRPQGTLDAMNTELQTILFQGLR